MTTNEIIRLENIRRNFIAGSETVHALRGVNFTINSGEFVTIMGTSGSGKSTLMNPDRASRRCSTRSAASTPPHRESITSMVFRFGVWVRTNGRFCEIGKSGSYFNPTTCCPKRPPSKMWNYPSCTTPPSRPKKGTNWHRKLLMPLDWPSEKIINPTKCREGNNSG